MPATPVDVVVLQEHGGRQDDVGHRRRLGHHLFVHADEKVLAAEAPLDLRLVRRDRHRVGVLDEHRRHRRTAEQGLRLAAKDRADARLVEEPDRGIADVAPFDERLVEAEDGTVGMEGAAALMLPGAGDRCDALRGMHVDGTVPRAAEAVAEAEEGAPGLADRLGKGLDLGDGKAGDRGGPLRRPVAQVCLELARRVGVFLEIIPVGKSIAEEDVHDRAGEGAVGAGLEADGDIRLLHGLVAVDVDDGDLRAALLAGADGMGHHVDLRRDRIGSPDDDEVGASHLARVGAGEPSGAGDEAGPGRAGADRVELAGIAFRVPQPINPVALHEAHGAGIVVGPDRLRAELRLRLDEGFRDDVEGVVPADALPSVVSRQSAAPDRASAFLPCGEADRRAGSGCGCVRRNARPWRRSRLPCSRCRARHGRGRWCARRPPRPRAHRSTDNHADRRNRRAARAGVDPWVATILP